MLSRKNPRTYGSLSATACRNPVGPPAMSGLPPMAAINEAIATAVATPDATDATTTVARSCRSFSGFAWMAPRVMCGQWRSVGTCLLHLAVSCSNGQLARAPHSLDRHAMGAMIRAVSSASNPRCDGGKRTGSTLIAFVLLVAVGTVGLLATTRQPARPGSSEAEARARAAIERAIPLLQTSARTWFEERPCAPPATIRVSESWQRPWHAIADSGSTEACSRIRSAAPRRIQRGVISTSSEK
jgi:hypothetical protein